MKTVTSVYLLAAFLTYFAEASSEHNKYCYNCIEGADTATLEKVKDDIKPCDENITLSNTKLYEDTVANHRPACYTVHANITMNSTMIIRFGDKSDSLCSYYRSFWEGKMGPILFYECLECYQSLCNSKRPPEPCKECKTCSSSKATKIEFKYFHIIYFAIFYELYQSHSFLTSPY